MSDEIRIYHVDDPNDAPERRLASLPALNPFIPTSLPQYVIPPVANSLYNAMQYYWYTAYQQGFAAQQQQQQLRLQQRHQQQQHQQQHQQQQVEQALHSVSTINQQHVGDSSLPTNQPSSNNRRQPSPQQTLCSVSSITSPSSLSPQQVSSSSSSSPQHHHSTNDVTTNNNYHHLNIKHQRPQQVASSTSSDDQLFSTAQLQHQLATTDHLHSPINNRLHSHHHHHHSYHQHHPQHHDQHIQLLSPISDGQPPTLETREPSSQHQNSNHQHIKKPLNPFMIYMQKQRPEIVKQGIIKESAAINQLLGQQWRKLSREEQEPYYKLAEQEKRMHAQKYPGWSARDNYANQKKRKKMRLRAISMNGATNCVDLSDKKCRARFGLSNMASWCKPCKRKKRCIYSLPKSSRNRSSIEQ